MADALSLVVNIMTVLDYGKRFATSAWKIFQSGKDGLSGISSLQLECEDLLQITQSLESPIEGLNGNDMDTRLIELRKRCSNIALQILQTLSELKIPEEGHGASRFLSSLLLSSQRDAALKAVVAVFRHKWKESDIKMLQDELDRLRSEMTLNIVFSCR